MDKIVPMNHVWGPTMGFPPDFCLLGICVFWCNHFGDGGDIKENKSSMVGSVFVKKTIVFVVSQINGS